jgi:hypothetical protein
MTLSIVILTECNSTITSLCKMSLSTMTIGRMTLSINTLSIMTLCIIVFGIMTHNIVKLGGKLYRAHSTALQADIRLGWITLLPLKIF